MTPSAFIWFWPARMLRPFHVASDFTMRIAKQKHLNFLLFLAVFFLRLDRKTKSLDLAQRTSHSLWYLHSDSVRVYFIFVFGCDWAPVFIRATNISQWDNSKFVEILEGIRTIRRASKLPLRSNWIRCSGWKNERHYLVSVFFRVWNFAFACVTTFASRLIMQSNCPSVHSKMLSKFIITIRRRSICHCFAHQFFHSIEIVTSDVCIFTQP